MAERLTWHISWHVHTQHDHPKSNLKRNTCASVASGLSSQVVDVHRGISPVVYTLQHARDVPAAVEHVKKQSREHLLCAGEGL